MLSSRSKAILLLSLCVLGGVIASAPSNQIVMVDNSDAETEVQPTRATVDAIPSAVDFRTDIPDFVPTHEWREVMDGQSVPGGLDIRFDFAKGKKYAKLIDGATAPPEIHTPKPAKPQERAADSPVTMEDAITKILRDDNAPVFKAPEPIKNLTDSLKSLLLELPEPDPDIVKGFSNKLSEEQMEEIYKKVWQKRQQEIADAYSKIRNEASVMKRLLRIVLERKGPASNQVTAEGVTAEGNVDRTELQQRGPTTEELLGVFAELQKTVEDLDNANDFKTLGGFAVSIDVLSDGYDLSPDPDSPPPTTFDRDAIKGHVAWVMGTAIKNQAHLQTSALKSGLTTPLLRLIKDLKTNPIGAAKGMYALGALLRNHQQAQQQFFELGGAQILIDLLETSFFDTNAEAANIIRQRHTVGKKIVALIEDLIIDSYSAPLLVDLLSEHCCNQLLRVFSKCQTNDEREKVLRALDAASTGCRQSWAGGDTGANMAQTLQRQVQEWKAEASDDDDDYLRDLSRRAEDVIHVLGALN